jgi:zinc transport system substrate-binding protein
MPSAWCTALFTLFLLTLAPAPRALAAEEPLVVVSIKPVHALVAGVMQGVAEPQLLVKAGGSPHGYALRPSEAQSLAKADLIVWVGPALESFLVKPLATLGRNAHQLELVEVLSDHLLPARKGGSWDEPEHAVGEVQNGAGGHHDEKQVNPHLWLSPLIAKQIVEQTAISLGELDPVHQTVYQRNAARLQQRLTQLHQQLTGRLAPVRTVPYIVFHDAYQYFESTYGLNAVGSISIDPERKPGIKRILEIRNKIKALNARCVFCEPQFEPRLVATIIEGTGARTGVLDPLGADLPAGPESYFRLLNNLADNLLAGLR